MTYEAFCGGVFDFDAETGLVYEVLQCGSGRDPLIVLDASKRYVPPTVPLIVTTE